MHVIVLHRLPFVHGVEIELGVIVLGWLEVHPWCLLDAIGLGQLAGVCNRFSRAHHRGSMLTGFAFSSPLIVVSYRWDGCGIRSTLGDSRMVRKARLGIHVSCVAIVDGLWRLLGAVPPQICQVASSKYVGMLSCYPGALSKSTVIVREERRMDFRSRPNRAPSGRMVVGHRQRKKMLQTLVSNSTGPLPH